MIDYGREAWDFLQLSIEKGDVRGIKLQDKFVNTWMKSGIFGVVGGPVFNPYPEWKLMGPRGFSLFSSVIVLPFFFLLVVFFSFLPWPQLVGGLFFLSLIAARSPLLV
jgi:hypothetical protein